MFLISKNQRLKAVVAAFFALMFATVETSTVSTPLKGKDKPPSEPIKPIGPQKPVPDPDAPIKPIGPKKPDPDAPIKPL